MKRYAKGLLFLVGLICFSQVFAQHGRYGGRYYNRYAYYNYRPYYPYYSPFRASVSIVARLPFGAVALTLGGRPYHYYNGIYYAPYLGGYTIVEPPMGVIVPVLPPNSVYVIIGGRPYYRYGGVYYMPLEDNRYQVVPEPKDESPKAATPKAESPNSSSNGYEKFTLDGKTYYKKGNKYYKAKVNDNGEIVYEEVGEIAAQ